MSTALLLYLVVNGIALVLCLCAARSAIFADPRISAAHRSWTLLAAAMLPPMVALAALCEPLGRPELRPFTACVPVLVLAAAWSMALTLRWQTPWLRLLALPVFVYGCLLTGIYCLRSLHDLLGMDCGLVGAAILAAQTDAQQYVGQVDAFRNPVWLWLPLMLPLAPQLRWTHQWILVIAAIIASGMLALLTLVMPTAYARVLSFRQPAPKLMANQVPPLGVHVPWGARVHDDRSLETWRDRVADLNVDHIVVKLTPEALADEAVLEQLSDEIDHVRERNLRVVVAVYPNRVLEMTPPRDVQELRNLLARGHWQAAQRLRPDLLVLFDGPFGALTRYTSRAPTLDEWITAIRVSAEEAKHAHPQLRVGVSIDRTAPHAFELFRWLKSNDSPVDEVCLSAVADCLTLPEQQARLETWKNWCQRTPGDKPLRLLTIGAGPHACGGELGQWRYLAEAMAMFANSGVSAMAIESLVDGECADGLTTHEGRLRLAFSELERLGELRNRLSAR